MASPPDAARLGDDDWQRLSTILDRFEAAWQAAGAADLDAFLPPLRDPLRNPCLKELVKSDFQFRWEKGQAVHLETYLRLYPELGGVDGVEAAVIYEEYRARHRYGDAPTLETFRGRFPRQYAELERLVGERPVASMAPPARTNTPPVVAEPVPTGRDLASTRPPPAAPPPPPPAVGGLRLRGPLEGFSCTRRLGSGAFAEVYAGTSPGGFPVAVKRLFQPLASDEAQRELTALEQTRKLRHTYLLQTHQYVVIDDRLFVVMELADGTLRDRLKECQAQGLPGIPRDELVRYFREAAEALDYMHREKVLHRDIKPQNILLLNGHVKVADFGLARLLQSQRFQVTTSGSGTPAYMAPEVWRGKVSERSDQYSLAMTYCEMRQGKWPFAGRDMFQLMLDHTQHEPNLEGYEAQEADALRQALRKDPLERFESCTAFVEALAPLSASERRSSGLGMPVVAEPEPAPEPVAPPTWRRWPVVVMALVLAGATATLPFLLRGGRPQEPPFRIASVTSQTLRAGEVRELRVFIGSRRTAETIPVTLDGVGEGVRASGGQIPPEADSVALRLEALPDALEGERTATVVAGSESISFPLAVRRADGALTAVKWSRAEGAALVRLGDRLFYDAINVDAAGELVRFRLAWSDERTRSEVPTEARQPFYLTRTKVTVRQFRRFVEVARPKLTHPDWDKATVPDSSRPVNRDAAESVYGVHVEDALRFADWLVPKHGGLPHPAQWDLAAGFYRTDRGEGPYRGTWAEWKGRSGAPGLGGTPTTAGAAADDESLLGFRDLAGNGLEWTRLASAEGAGGTVALPAPPGVRVRSLLMRGVSYTAREPLRFDRPSLDAVPADAPRGDIGFRVVFEP